MASPQLPGMEEDPSQDIGARLMTGTSLTVTEALERVENLTHEMRESEPLVKRLVARLQFIHSALKKRSLLAWSELPWLAARFAMTVREVLQFLKKFFKKKGLQRIAASRLVREGVRRLHSSIDIVFQDAGLSDALEMTKWKEYEEADIAEQRERLEELVNTKGVVIRDLSSAEVEEALLEIRLELERHNNPEEFMALLNRAFTDPDATAEVTATALELEDWFVRRDDIEMAETPFDMGEFCDEFKGKSAEGVEVCVKLLFIDGPGAQESFLKEARIWHRLSHPNVLKMLGGCHMGSPLFVVSKFAKAGDFVDYLYKAENKGKLWGLFRQAAQGLAYIHSQEVVHADIKCSNLLVGDDGLAKLCGFGFRYIKTLSTVKSRIMQPSSARWKAPECLVEHGPAGMPRFASDVFSLGMSIIEAKTGNVPWGMKSDDEIFDATLDGDCYPRPDGDIFTDREWELVSGMTAFNLANRWSLDRALEVMRELEILNKEEILNKDGTVASSQQALANFRVESQAEASTVRNGELVDRVMKSNPGRGWTRAQVTEYVSNLIEEERTAAASRASENAETEDSNKPNLPNLTTVEEKLRPLVDHIQRTPSLTDNDRDRFLQQIQQVSDWYKLEAEMATQWESNFPDISLCSSCESENPLDNWYCCECGEAFVGGSWQARREKLDFRFTVPDLSTVEAAIASMEELCDHARAKAVVLRRDVLQCPACLEPAIPGKRFCGDCGNRLVPESTNIEVRVKLQSEIQRLRRIVELSRDQEELIRKANAVPPLELPCSRCGKMNSEFEIFCHECGHDIEIIRENPL